MAADRATAVLVVGMHRSGTSALAGVLSKLGIPLGSRLLEPGDDNPKGYWEHRDIVSVHERLLTGLDSRWDDVRALPADWLASEPARRAAASLKSLIVRDFSGKPVWAVKDPRLCRLLPLWFEVLGQLEIRPVMLFMVRKPSEVSASIETRNHWLPPIGEMLWLRYMTEAEAASREVSRSVVVFDDLLADPLSTVTSALTIVGVWTRRAPTQQERAAVGGFVDVAERHHVHPETRSPPSKFATLAAKLYALLVSIAHGAGAWDKAVNVAADFEREWRKNGAALDAVADMAARLEADAQSNWIEFNHAKSSLDAQLRWSREAVAKYETLQAENAELASKLTAQIHWSEEAQSKRESLQAENAELSSKLTAQIRWSDEAQAKHEALQAENAELSSKLTAQIRWSDEAQAKHEALQAENAELSSKLTAQIRWSEDAAVKQQRLQTVCDDLRHKAQADDRLSGELRQARDEAEQERKRLSAGLQEVTADRDRLRGELRQARDEAEQERKRLSAGLQEVTADRDRLRGELRQATGEAEQERKRLSAGLQEVTADRDRLRGELQQAKDEAASLTSMNATIENSWSWKLTRPLRAIAKRLQGNGRRN